MSDLSAKLKKWVESMQSGQFQEIVNELTTIIPIKLDDRTNKVLFNLLLHLSHAASKCEKTDTNCGAGIRNLAVAICSTLLKVPDEAKFFSSIYHIIRCLLVMKLHVEAMDVCDYAIPGRLVVASQDTMIYINFSELFRNAANAVFNVLSTKWSDETYRLFVTLFKYHLQLLRIKCKRYPRDILFSVTSFLEKTTTLAAKFDPLCIEQSFDLMMGQILSLSFPWSREDRFTNFRYLLRFASTVIVERIKEGKIARAAETLEKTCRSLEGIVKTGCGSSSKKTLDADEECCVCFFLFERVALNFMTSGDSFAEDHSGLFRANVYGLRKAVDEFGCENAVKWVIYALTAILDSLFLYWERRDGALTATAETSREMWNFLTYAGDVLAATTMDTCAACHREACGSKRDLYNPTLLKLDYLKYLCRVHSRDSLAVVAPLVCEGTRDCAASIVRMKFDGCELWKRLWESCGVQMYNFAVCCQKDRYDDCVELFQSLCRYVATLGSISSNSSCLDFSNPRSFILYKLGILHMNQGRYVEASHAAAYGALLDLDKPRSKSLSLWLRIKEKYPDVVDIKIASIWKCLRAPENTVRDIVGEIDWKGYDLVELCLREMEYLQDSKDDMSTPMETILENLELLQADSLRYAHGVQLLAHHRMRFQCDDELERHMDLAELKLATDESRRNSPEHRALLANFEFYRFVASLSEVSRQTRMEMESVKFMLYAPRSATATDQPQNADNVVPAYTMINVKKDAWLLAQLKKAVERWNECIDDIITRRSKDDRFLQFTLYAIMTAAEYCRFHQFPVYEIRAWKLACKLIKKMQDEPMFIYAVGRCISSRYINDEWITTAGKVAEKLRSSEDSTTMEVVGIFWLSLADYYFENGRKKEAAKLFEAAVKLPKISPCHKLSTYLLSQDTILHNGELQNDDVGDRQYATCIVQSLYCALSLHEFLQSPICKKKYLQLYGYEVLFCSSFHLSLRMNSFFSFREICAHLGQRLKTAQRLGAPLRVAECLKFLCFIDLSRMQLDDCEVKLQGLEHILDIETFELSMLSKAPAPNIVYPLASPNGTVDPVRDIGQSDASPVLRGRTFDVPGFLSHKNCSCYKCENLSYQYLVFASTYIRAQLCVLQKQQHSALQHFHGALKIRQRLFERERKNSAMISRILSECEGSARQLIRNNYYNMSEYVLFLLDYSRFVKQMKPASREALSIALLAIETCESCSLKSHPIYVAAMELELEYRTEKIFEKVDRSKFTVPDLESIDIQRFVREENIVDNSACVTPMHEPRPKKPLSVRREKTPPFLKLTKVSIDFHDDEDEGNSPRPVLPTIKTYSARKNAARRIFDEHSESSQKTDKSIPALEERMKPVANPLKSSHDDVLGGRLASRESRKGVVDSGPTTTPLLVRKNAPIENGTNEITSASKQSLQSNLSIPKSASSAPSAKRNSKARDSSRTAAKSRIVPPSKSSSAAKIDETVDLFNAMVISMEGVGDSRTENASSETSALMRKDARVENRVYDETSKVTSEKLPPRSTNTAVSSAKDKSRAKGSTRIGAKTRTIASSKTKRDEKTDEAIDLLKGLRVSKTRPKSLVDSQSGKNSSVANAFIKPTDAALSARNGGTSEEPPLSTSQTQKASTVTRTYATRRRVRMELSAVKGNPSKNK